LYKKAQGNFLLYALIIVINKPLSAFRFIYNISVRIESAGVLYMICPLREKVEPLRGSTF
jgi:hypothetical protein